MGGLCVRLVVKCLKLGGLGSIGGKMSKIGRAWFDTACLTCGPLFGVKVCLFIPRKYGSEKS